MAAPFPARPAAFAPDLGMTERAGEGIATA